MCEAHLSPIIKVDLQGELFTYAINERALKHARLMDGKLLLVTNTPDLTPEEVLNRYKSLADIERGFRVLKSSCGGMPDLRHYMNQWAYARNCRTRGAR